MKYSPKNTMYKIGSIDHWETLWLREPVYDEYKNQYGLFEVSVFNLDHITECPISGDLQIKIGFEI